MKSWISTPGFTVLLLSLFAGPADADILYMANSDGPGGANYIMKYGTQGGGTCFADWTSGLSTPLGLAFDSAANLYVANNTGGAVLRFTPDGVGSVFVGGLSSPTGLAFSRAGDLFVSCGGSIRKLSPDGTDSAFAGTLGVIGLAFDSTDHLYAASQTLGSILKFMPDGSSSTFAGGFSAPEGLAFDRSGNLFVVDITARTISKVRPDGTVSLFASGLVNPVGLAFDTAGDLYVGDADGIKKFTPDGTGSMFLSSPFGNGWPTFVAFTDDDGIPLPLANQVPEPAIPALLGLGLLALVRRKKVAWARV